MSNQLNKIQNNIIKEFSKLNDWLDIYEYIIKLGMDLESVDEKLKSEENLLSGCQSQVWLKAEVKNNKIYYFADSDSLITRGILSLILRVVNKQDFEDIKNADFYFIDRIGLKSNLSPSRANGLLSIIKNIKSLANKAGNF
jgi:cysteine desulfuration protein SufE